MSSLSEIENVAADINPADISTRARRHVPRE
jgi:hypothetical protein